MSPALSMTVEEMMTLDESKAKNQQRFLNGVKKLCENGVTKVPYKYILPPQDRPINSNIHLGDQNVKNLQLPIIDFAELVGPNRARVLESLSHACEEYGFFQVVNHGISSEVITRMVDATRRFFELPFDERNKFMSSDMRSPVRYGTSFNQNNDSVFCWRDFLKLVCTDQVVSQWPSSPVDFRDSAMSYAKDTKNLFVMLMEAILESLGITDDEGDEKVIDQFVDSSQMMVLNCYPLCPQPDLTLGMPPHSDYGFLTLLLQDEVAGLQIQHRGNWVVLDPKPNSFVVNVGDHLEIFSNGRYKSVLHRVLVNAKKDRISVASLHSLPFDKIVSPSPKLVDESNPKRYKDTNFASFLEYASSFESTKKSFLETRKLY